MMLNPVSVTSLLLSYNLITSLMLCTVLNQTFCVSLEICHTKWSDDYIPFCCWRDELWGLVSIISGAPRMCIILYKPDPVSLEFTDDLQRDSPKARWELISQNLFKDNSKVLTSMNLWFVVYSSKDRVMLTVPKFWPPVYHNGCIDASGIVRKKNLMVCFEKVFGPLVWKFIP